MSATAGRGLTSLTLALEVASAVFGIVSAYLMTRRYASSFFMTLLFALLTPLLFLIGRGPQVREYYAERSQVARDVPTGEGQALLGYHLLFWAFLLQLAATFL